ncbi:MAG TPA: hypothetical protein GX511_01895, partial [Firmicutes bacterium]|nr:hypothetical protein [Bacillota bacterium]
MENKPADLGRLLARTLEEAPAVRLGECTVISRFVHVIQVEQPAEVRVVAAADAGQVFYGRTRAGTVYHIDTFHALGKVDHRQVANAIRKAVDVQTGIRSSALLDRLDLQTGTGGGRVSGSLTYGRKPSLRRAHANHVHLAAGLAPGELPLLVPIVASVEAEILRQGLEIRKVERVVLDTSPQGGGSGADLSPYASETDSLLRESGSRSGTPQVHQESGQWEGEANTQELLALARETLPPQELLRLLRNLPFEPRTAEHIKRWGDLEHTLGSLQAHNLIRQERGRLVLTPRGQALSAFLHQHLPELESMFRQLLRRVPLEGKGKTPTAKSGVRDGSAALRTRGGALNTVCSEELDLPGTVGVAARRWCQGVGYPGVLEPVDLVYSQP